MNRNISIVVITLVIFSIIYFFSQKSEDESLIEKETVEDNFVSVYQLTKDVKRGERLKRDSISTFNVKKSDLLSSDYVEANYDEIPSDSVYKNDIKSGTLLHKSQYISPGESDYLNYLLNSDELPYLYENVTSFTAKSLNLNTGDRISFISTMSGDRNVLHSGYSDIENLTSKIIINDVRVLQVFTESKGEDDEEKTSIVVSLKPKEILKLELSKKISEISIIPSSFINKNLKLKSSEILESKLRVRELRGRD